MDNFKSTNNDRRFKAHVSALGTTQLHLRNPYIIAWWSAAFPGFGHLLLSKYLRGYSLFLWEILVNNMAKHQLGHYVFFFRETGDGEELLDPKWMLPYLPVYGFGIWEP